MIKVGIFFGGSSREREISFLGGRTIYDRLDRNIFDPIPIFVDSFGNFILLNWQNIYKGTIKDFFPLPIKQSQLHEINYIESIEDLKKIELDKIIKRVGIQVFPHEFHTLIDFAFVNLNGKNGEDGSIQGILKWYNIPFSGSDILGSAISINKSISKKICNSYENNNSPYLNYKQINFDTWQHSNKTKLYENLKEKFGLPFVVKSNEQGSSIGVSIIDDFSNFEKNVEKCFFIKKVSFAAWSALTEMKKNEYIKQEISDLKTGLGFPIIINNKILYDKDKLITFLNSHFSNSTEELLIESTLPENNVIFEKFINGREFSCIVIEHFKNDRDSEIIVLPPTEIKNKKIVFDYRSKYLPGIVSKNTPMDIDFNIYKKIKQKCIKLFKDLFCNVYARIDGFLLNNGEIYICDPNTVPGMNTSSFLFNQAAEIGFSPTDFLTFLIKNSLLHGIKNKKFLFDNISKTKYIYSLISNKEQKTQNKIKVGILMGGYNSERHVSLESGRNIYDKLKASTTYEPIPIFLSGSPEKNRLFLLPINILLKDNADDIHEICMNSNAKKFHNTIVEEILQSLPFSIDKKNKNIKEIKYENLGELVDFVFLALHGRPGEDGTIQKILEENNIPYNGSSVDTSKLTINKYDTNTFLKSKRMYTTNQKLVLKKLWRNNKSNILKDIQASLSYPLIAKPVDEGCSTAVIKIKDEKSLINYIEIAFRDNSSTELNSNNIHSLDIVLLEEYIEKNSAINLVEITIGFVSEFDDNNNRTYFIFDPSQVILKNEVLSLDEKFLAGEGQNITPAIFSENRNINTEITKKVKKEIYKAIELLNLEGYGRIDAFVKIYKNYMIDLIIIEINSLPAMTPATCIFHQCALAGYKPYDFIDAIIKYGIKRNSLKKQLLNF